MIGRNFGKKIMTWFSGPLLATVLSIGAVAPAAAADNGPRLALVIANSAYAQFDALGAPAIDGDRIAQALSAAGFQDGTEDGSVKVHQNLGRAGMAAKVQAFQTKLRAAGPSAFGVLYFSGHGAALASFGDVALIGIDSARQPMAEDLGLTRAFLVQTLLGSGAANILVILDMCRNIVSLPPAGPTVIEAGQDWQPVPAGSKGLRRLVREGNAPARSDQGYLVAFSTSADQFAFDNGVFSRILAEEIARPRQNIADALKRTSDRVAISALKDGKTYQKPTFDYGLQGSPPCFLSCDAEAEGRFFDCANCPYMRIVPSGVALIGSSPTEPGRRKDEPAQSRVRIDRPFAVSVYEISVSEWAACVKDGACTGSVDWTKENPNPLLPAAGISFAQANAFVAWLAAQTDLPYRLPTELEWEYAARGGADSIFPWGDEIAPANANYDHTASFAKSPTAPYRGYPEAINGYPPNGFGLYQMSGNLWEWTDGCAEKGCSARIARGGSFDSAPSSLRPANRFAIASTKKRDDVGLRVVRDLRPDER